MTPTDDYALSQATSQTSLTDALVAAVSTAIGEMAGVNVGAHLLDAMIASSSFADITVAVELQSSKLASIAFNFPAHTATALAERILSGTQVQVSNDLTMDCLCEFANVVTGQVKTLLAGTPYDFTFFVPTIADAGWRLHTEQTVVIFESEIGRFDVVFRLKTDANRT